MEANHKLHEIIEGCKKRKVKSQDELFRMYAPKYRVLCRRYVSLSDEAEDILQEGFLKIFDNIHQYENKGSFEGWIKRIIVNQAISFYRKNKKNDFAEITQQNIILEDSDDENTFIDSYDGLITAQEIMILIQELPVGYKTIFNMYSIEKMPHKEIAEMMGISEVGSRTQLSRARKLLQDRIIELINHKKQNNQNE